MYRKKLENACQNLPPGLFYGSERARNLNKACARNKNECRNAVFSEREVGEKPQIWIFFKKKKKLLQTDDEGNI